MKTHNLKLSIDFCGAVLNGEKTLRSERMTEVFRQEI